jgi:hypothetical protein
MDMNDQAASDSKFDDLYFNKDVTLSPVEDNDNRHMMLMDN